MSIKLYTCRSSKTFWGIHHFCAASLVRHWRFFLRVTPECLHALSSTPDSVRHLLQEGPLLFNFVLLWWRCVSWFWRWGGICKWQLLYDVLQIRAEACLIPSSSVIFCLSRSLHANIGRQEETCSIPSLMSESYCILRLLSLSTLTPPIGRQLCYPQRCYAQQLLLGIPASSAYSEDFPPLGLHTHCDGPPIQKEELTIASRRVTAKHLPAALIWKQSSHLGLSASQLPSCTAPQSIWMCCLQSLWPHLCQWTAHRGSKANFLKLQFIACEKNINFYLPANLKGGVGFLRPLSSGIACLTSDISDFESGKLEQQHR